MRAVISPSQVKDYTFAIVISEKGGSERREVFAQNEISVGRVQGNDLTLPKGNVSKRHARLIYRDSRFIVSDLNSTNGTYVNRRRISQATIVREGDRVYIGDFVLRIEVPESESQSDSVSETGSGPIDTHSPPVHSPTPSAVPGPPQLPDARVDSEVPGSGSHSVDVSLADMDARALAPAHEDQIDRQTQELRRALARVVDGVLAEIGEESLRGTPTEEVSAAVEQAIESQVQDISRRGELGGLDAGPIRESAAAELLRLGPVSGLLADSNVTTVSIPRFDSVFATRRGRLMRVEPPFSSQASLERVLARLCVLANEPMAESETSLERTLPGNIRLSALRGGDVLDVGPLVILEKPLVVLENVENLVRDGVISRAMATFLHHCVSARLNVLVVGPRDGGTARVASALASVDLSAPMIAVAETEDVSQHHTAAARIRGPSEYAQVALRLASRGSSTRVVAELSRGELCAALIDAIGAGTDGVVATVHATNSRRALARIAADVAASRGGANSTVAREWVFGSFDLVVEVACLRDGRHRVVRIAELATGSHDHEMLDVYRFVAERMAAGGAVEGTFIASGTMPHLADDVSARGFSLDSSLFARTSSR